MELKLIFAENSIFAEKFTIMITALLLSFYILTPFFIIMVCKKWEKLNKIGTVVIAYIIGVIFGNSGILPKASETFRVLLNGKSYMQTDKALTLFNNGIIGQSDLNFNHISTLQEMIMTVVIPLSIPLLLFSMNIKDSVKYVKRGMLSLLLGVVALLVTVFIGFLIFNGKVADLWKISGMLVGVYTGGTPNLAAIAAALDVDPTIFILTNTYDLIISSLILLLFITAGQRLFNLFLVHFKPIATSTEETNISESVDMNLFQNKFTWKAFLDLLKGIGISIAIFAIGGGVSFIVPEEFKLASVILTITTLGIIFSMFKPINRLEKTFDAGMYLILIFSLVVASLANFSNIMSIGFLNLFLYVAYVVMVSMIIHVLLSKLFKVDTDTTLIAITALTLSPPFVPVVAGALKNKQVILTGITIGVIGYAIGNYLGFAIAYILK